MLPQDLHIHTVFSSRDSSVVSQQTVQLVAFTKHARIVGISDHFDNFMPNQYNEYANEVRKYGLLVGAEVDGHKSVDLAIEYEFDYYIYHCWGNQMKDYDGFDKLLTTGKPVVIAHPCAVDTDLNRIHQNSLVEINNRYIWRYDWKRVLKPFIKKFRWIFSSDAHQPNWLNQTIARRVGQELGISETILFEKPVSKKFKKENVHS